MDKVSLDLLRCVVDNQEKFIIIYHNGDIILTNRAFNDFFGVGSTDEFNSNFGKLIDSFVPHPYYFHKEKVASDELWFDALLRLPSKDRIVSMITQNFEPHAFSVEIESSLDKYKIVSLTDITQSLVKRIMIENNANMDTSSGAYSKKYFLQISRSYQDAALFNEKIIATIFITIKDKKSPLISKFVDDFKLSIRQDDMLIRWSDNSFLLVYLTESEEHAKKMFLKLKNRVTVEPLKEFGTTLELYIQKEKESINSLIRRVTSP